MKIHKLEEKMTPPSNKKLEKQERENGDQFREPADHRKIRNNV